ncbi:unnamed protein product [Tenebrio molitor]|nr:unnamed protein product [Tenebrio molitor]
MADVENQTASSVTTGSAATPQSHAKKEKKAKNPRAKPSHPPTSEMVNNAIKGLKERGGSSLQAIKKFVAANYKVDAEKVAPFIKKYLKGAVASGSLVQTKGKGASGSFKLASSTSGGAKVASASDKRKPASSAASKTKKSSAKRTAVATTSDKASSKTAKNKPPPKRRRLLPKRRAPPLPPPPQRKPRNRPPPRQKRKLEPPRNPDRLPKRRNLTRLVRLKNPKHPNPRQPKPFLSK